MRALALTDHQMALVRRAAGSVRPAQRDQFLQQVTRFLADTPSDAAVVAAIQAALGRLPVSVFMNDSATKRGARS